MKREQGYMMIEMLVVCAVLMIMLAMALPNAMAMKKLAQQGQAKKQAQLMYQLMAASKACAVSDPTGGSCLAVNAMIPSGTRSNTLIGGYHFVLNNPDNTTWWYKGIPIDPTLQTVYMDATGQLLCNSNPCTASWN